MKKKYILYPDRIKSRTDGDIHFISSQMLVKLYNVKIEECLIYGTHWTSHIKDELIPLRPRISGRYPDMSKEQGDK